QMVHVIAGEGARRRESELRADLLGDARVVAGYDLDGDAEFAQTRDGCGCVAFRRVEEHEKAGEDEVVFVDRRDQVQVWRGPGGEGDDASPAYELGIEQAAGLVGHIDAAFQHSLGRTLGDDAS